MSSRSARWLAIGAVYGAASAHVGHCLGHDDSEAPPVSPEAHAWVLETPEGQLEAGVDVVHPTSGAVVAVRSLELSIDGERRAGSTANTIEVEGYDPVANYSLSFTVDEATGIPAGPYALAKHGPLERPSTWWHDPTTVAWDPAGLLAYVELRNAEGVLWSNRHDLQQDGRLEVPADLVAEATQVVVCGVEVLRASDAPSVGPAHADALDRLEGQLGYRSTMIVGRCNELAP